MWATVAYTLFNALHVEVHFPPPTAHTPMAHLGFNTGLNAQITQYSN